MQLAYSLIASTCTQNRMMPLTANDKYYEIVKDLDIVVFRS
ncbi:MAG: hypothetical protein PHO62_01050 [Sulfurimonas sp.]|nr:hypothetical protein [Sulfurimonas sp.]MDD5371992.1 hypothetical protein [Sulfurimonas sp.]